MVLSTGLRINIVAISWIVAPLTLFCIVGAINAFNLIDGMDGLCVGVSLVSCFGFFLLGIRSGNVFLVWISAVLFMSLLGFFPFNFYPARIFLGDAGSGFLGFIFGVMVVIAAQQVNNSRDFIIPLLIIGLPIPDIGLAIFRRLLKARPLFIGDRDHLYDVLLKKGWSQPKVWIVVCGLQMLLVIVALELYKL